MAQRKNSNGAGSIYRDKTKTGRWVGAITVTDHTGTRKRRKVIGTTQGEVRDRLEALRRSVDVDPTLPDTVTVARFLKHWSTEVLPLADVSQVTVDGYQRIVRLYITPTIGKVRLDQLTPAHVRKMLATLKQQDLSPNTMRQARSVLRRALRTAEADELVTRNVAAIVDGVKMDAPKGRTLTPDQARKLLTGRPEHHCARLCDDQESCETCKRPKGSHTPINACAACDRWEDYGMLLTLLLATGIRKGEALGLGWPSLDLDATPATLTVSRSLKIAADHTTFLDQPKTAGSRRRIHLPGPVVDALRKHGVKQKAERLAFGPDWGGDWAAENLVFTSSVGSPLDPHRASRAVKAITTDALGESWTPHEMRHSAASLMLAQGVPLKTVSETLGHSSIRVTADVYGHLLEPAKTEAADAMDRVLFS